MGFSVFGFPFQPCHAPKGCPQKQTHPCSSGNQCRSSLAGNTCDQQQSLATTVEARAIEKVATLGGTYTVVLGKSDQVYPVQRCCSHARFIEHLPVRLPRHMRRGPKWKSALDPSSPDSDHTAFGAHHFCGDSGRSPNIPQPYFLQDSHFGVASMEEEPTEKPPSSDVPLGPVTTCSMAPASSRVADRSLSRRILA